MRPAEFTHEQIIDAGNALIAANRTVTGFALAKAVGGGKPARLKTVWDDYLSSQSVVVAEPVAELPDDMAEELKTVMGQLGERMTSLALDLNTLAIKSADRRVHDLNREITQVKEQAAQEITDATTTLEEMDTLLDRTTTQLAQLAEQLQ
ncbi:DNA-binding protein, partial [Pseudomonas aeruginosa]